MKIIAPLLTILAGITILVITSASSSQAAAAAKREVTSNSCPTMDQNCINFDSVNVLYHINGNLGISGNITGSYTGLVFVDGDLNISADYYYGTSSTGPVAPLIGTVFVIKGNINISPSVTRIDAVLISQGKIYTAGTNCAPSSVTTSPLVINGSLISLSQDNKIQFCRTLTDNTQAAEKINHQVKYLVILKDLISDTLQKWSEIP